MVDRGHSVAEVSERLGVSVHSLHKWVKAIKPDKTDEQAAALIEARDLPPTFRSTVNLVESVFKQGDGHEAQEL